MSHVAKIAGSALMIVGAVALTGLAIAKRDMLAELGKTGLDKAKKLMVQPEGATA